MVSAIPSSTTTRNSAKWNLTEKKAFHYFVKRAFAINRITIIMKSCCHRILTDNLPDS